jgi:hypothetical protein
MFLLTVSTRHGRDNGEFRDNPLEENEFNPLIVKFWLTHHHLPLH